MIQQHFALFLMGLSLVDSAPYVFMMMLGLFSAPVFFMLVGICVVLSVEKRKGLGEEDFLIRKHILRRGIILVIVGFLFMTIWEGDVLHYIGAFILVTYLTLSLSIRARFITGVAIIAISPLMRYAPPINETQPILVWQFKNSWGFSEFIRDVFGSNFDPVFPWLSITILGSIVGSLLSQSLKENRKKNFQLNLFKAGSVLILAGAQKFLFNVPFDVYPALYVILTIGATLLLLSGLIWLSEIKGYAAKALSPLILYGKLSLSVYIGHIIIWLGTLNALGLLLSLSLHKVMTMLFSCYISTWMLGSLWLKIKGTGPLELVISRFS